MSHVTPLPSRILSSGNVIIKVNHSTVGDRTVKMGASHLSMLILLCCWATVINGHEIRRGRLEGGSPSAEDCSRPPMSKFGHECCRLPKERIWGDLRPSLNMCFRQMKREQGPMRQEETDEGREMVTPGGMPTPTGIPSDWASTPSTIENRGRSRGRTPYHLRRRANDSCFMECVFQDQGFLVEKVLNKNALLERLAITLGQNEPWYRVATEAVETCYQMQVPSDKTCNSGSEEMFRCVLKQIFFNCPNWTQNDYCMALREFYQKCPNGPPPEINDDQSTSAPLPEEDMETSPPTESESTQSE